MKETPPNSDSYIDRFRSWATSKANGHSLSNDTSRSTTLPVTNTHTHEKPVSLAQQNATTNDPPSSPRGTNHQNRQVATATANKVADQTLSDHPPPAPPPQADGEGPVVEPEKPQRKNVAVRFYITARSIILSSYINILLVVVPVGIAAKAANLKPGIVFGMNAIAIIPLAGLLSHATESVAKRMGDTIGALMNVTFGNAVELIIFMYVYLTRDQGKKEREALLKGIIVSIESHIIVPVLSPFPLPRARCPIALQKNEIRIVQASLLGSILANLLLILGMCFLVGGLRFREQIYNSTVTQMSACLLSLSVMSLLLPTAFHASFSSSQEDKATNSVLKVSRGTSVVLLIVYGMYLLFQLKSHAYMYESTPQHIIDEESAPGPVAHWMESSDSDSDSSSGSESSSSSASNTTAKRIRRAIVGRRRRKSSSGSKDTADADATRSPSITALSGSPTDGAADDLHSAEDGDDEDRERGHTRSRKNSFIGALSKRDRRKHRKRREKREGKRAQCDSVNTTNESAVASASAQKKPEEDPNAPRHIDFAVTEDAGVVTDSSQKRPFTFLGISSTIRPTVFTQPPTVPEPVPSSPVPRVKYGIRRTNSLPDRLNQTYSGPIRTPATNLQPVRIASTAIAEQNLAKEGDEENISRTTAVLLLLISTGLVAVCAEFMVDSINAVVSGNSGLSEAFIGLIILPIVGNAAEHVTAVTVASKNKMDLAIGVAVGSSIQIALFVTPFIVLLGWCMSKDMSLYFTLFETVCLFVSAFIVNFLVLDGRSNYLEGSLLCAAYVIIAVAAFFYPQVGDQSVLGGNPDASSRIMLARSVIGSIVGM